MSDARPVRQYKAADRVDVIRLQSIGDDVGDALGCAALDRHDRLHPPIPAPRDDSRSNRARIRPAVVEPRDAEPPAIHITRLSLGRRRPNRP